MQPCSAGDVSILVVKRAHQRMNVALTVLSCLLGMSYPGRKDLFTGWCGCLSKHLLSLPFWVCGFNDRKWLWAAWQNEVHGLPRSNTFAIGLTTFSPFCRICEERYPKLTAYYNSLKDRPSIKSTWPPTWLTTQGQDSLKDIWDSGAHQLTN